MKYLMLLILLSLFGCSDTDSYTKTELDRILKESIKFCSCRGGLDTFGSTGGVVQLNCMDGTSFRMTGDYGDMKILGCLK